MENCPICFTELEIRECTPCYDCGWDIPTELEHLREGRHTYAVYEVIADLRITLCNTCAVDFSSYTSEYFGFQNAHLISLKNFSFIKDIRNPQSEFDKFCPTCNRRFKFLKFMQSIREWAQSIAD